MEDQIADAATGKEKGERATRERNYGIGLNFQHIARLRNRFFDKLMTPHNLTAAQVRVMNLLLRRQGLSQVELARILGIGTVAVSTLLDRMERDGWVVRKPDSKDRRSNRVWLTEAGIAKEQVLVEGFTYLNDVAFDGFTDAELDLLVDLLRRTRINLAKACDD